MAGIGTGLALTFSPPTFRPTFLPNLALWLRGDKGVTVTGSGVSSWVDPISGLNFVQGTDGARPPLVDAAGLGNRPALDFDGTADWLEVASAASLANVNSSTWFWAIDADGAGTTNRNLLRGGVSALGGIIYHTNASLQVGVYDGTAHRSNTAAVTGSQYLSLQLNAGGTSAQFRRNGADLGAALVYDGTFAINTANTLAIGGPPGGAAEWFNGRIAEFIAYSRVLTAQEINRVESYMKARYSL